MMNTPSLRARLDAMIGFFRSDYPELVDGLLLAIRDIEKLYEKARQPFGAGKSLEWFESEYTRWREKQEMDDPSTQEQVTKALEEGKSLGDFNANGSPNHKAVARDLVLTLSSMVSLADEEKRGFTAYEQFHFEYKLVLSLAQVRDMGKKG